MLSRVGGGEQEMLCCYVGEDGPEAGTVTGPEGWTLSLGACLASVALCSHRVEGLGNSCIWGALDRHSGTNPQGKAREQCASHSVHE